MTKRKRNQNTLAYISDTGNGDINKIIKNLLSVIKLAKSKKPNFLKKNSSRIEFFFLKAKEAFIYLQNNFIKIYIFHYLDQECFIYTKIDDSGYPIDKVLYLIISNYWDQLFHYHAIHKNLDLNFLNLKLFNDI